MDTLQTQFSQTIHVIILFSKDIYLLSHLTIVAELVSVLLALMWADDELEVLSVQKVLCDIRTPVTSSSSDLIGNTTIMRHGITPQQVQNLNGQNANYYLTLYTVSINMFMFNRKILNYWLFAHLEWPEWNVPVTAIEHNLPVSTHRC